MFRRPANAVEPERLVPFGPTVMHMPDPNALRSKKVRARYQEIQRELNDPCMRVMAELALSGDQGVAQIVQSLPDPRSCGLARWPDHETLTHVAQVPLLYFNHSEPHA